MPAPPNPKKNIKLPCSHLVDATEHLKGERYYQCPIKECSREFVVKANMQTVITYESREVWEKTEKP